MEKIKERIIQMVYGGFTKLVVVMRHGEKAGDALTPKGAAQVFAAATQLKKILTEVAAEINSSLLPVWASGPFYSGLERARQTALVAAAAINGGQIGLNIQVSEELSFKKSLDANYTDPNDFAADWEALKTAHAGRPTVADGLAALAYAQHARVHLIDGVITLASMPVKGFVFGASHSPFTEMATCQPDETPFGLGEADVMIYAVKIGKIVDSLHLPAPAIG